jgi:hypothetical protein
MYEGSHDRIRHLSTSIPAQINLEQSQVLQHFMLQREERRGHDSGLPMKPCPDKNEQQLKDE